MKHFDSSHLMRTAVFIVAVSCALLASCSMDSGAGAGKSAADDGGTGSTRSAGSSGVNMRDVVGDFCPPAQATKGNC